MKGLGKVLLIACALSGCYERDQGYRFSWAIADFSAIESKVVALARERNPYPDSLQADRSQLRTEISQLTSTIYSARRTATAKCGGPTGSAELHGGLLSTSEARVKVELQRQKTRSCLDEAEQDPLLKDLSVKKSEVETKIRELDAYDKRVREFAAAYARGIIDEYSKNKFELVIDGRQKPLYNKNGLALNVTEALIATIDERKLVLPEPELDLQK